MLVAAGQSDRVDVMRNLTSNGSPSFSFSATSISTPNPLAVALADINADGKLDVAASRGDGATVFGDPIEGVAVALNTTSMPTAVSFATPVAVTTNTNLARGVAAGDINGDGKPDLVVTGRASTADHISVLLNTTANGASTPTFAAPYLASVSNRFPVPNAVTLADMNADGRVDPVVTTSAGDEFYPGPIPPGVFIFPNETPAAAASATLGAPVPLVAGEFPEFSAVGDLDGDTRPDIATGSYVNGGRTLTVFTNLTIAEGTPTFSAEHFAGYPDQTRASGVAVGDLDLDDKPDIALATFQPPDPTTGLAALLQRAPDGGVAPSQLGFAEQAVGGTSASRSITVSNQGEGVLSLGTASISGPAASDFSRQSDSCSGALINPNQACVIGVAFTPSALGSRTASLTIASNDSGTPHTVALSGTGVAPPPAGTDTGSGSGTGAVTATAPGPAAGGSGTTVPTNGFAGAPLRSRTLRVDSRRRTRVTLECPADAGGNCTVTVSLFIGSGRVPGAARVRRIASGRRTIAPAQRSAIRLRLSRSGMKALQRRGRLRARALVVSTDSRGARVAKVHTVRLTRARR